MSRFFRRLVFIFIYSATPGTRGSHTLNKRALKQVGEISNCWLPIAPQPFSIETYSTQFATENHKNNVVYEQALIVVVNERRCFFVQDTRQARENERLLIFLPGPSSALFAR